MVPKLLLPYPAASVLARDENPLPTPAAAAEPAAATAAAAADCRPVHIPTVTTQVSPTHQVLAHLTPLSKST